MCLVFSRVLACLTKIGEEGFIEARKHQFLLSTINSSRSAFAIFTFSPRFFENYEIKNTSEGGEQLALRCKILLKAVAPLFRGKANTVKSIERCELRLEEAVNVDVTSEDNGASECRLVVQMFCRFGIVKTHKLIYEQCETFHAIYDKRNCSHHFTISPHTLSNWIAHFHTKLDEITMSCGPGWIRFRSFTDEGLAAEQAEDFYKRPLSTELGVDVEEFEKFNVQCDIELTFNLKEFKAIIAYAEAMNLSLSVWFDSPGKPLLLTFEHADHVSADFVLATLSEQMGQSQTSSGRGLADPSLGFPEEHSSYAKNSPNQVANFVRSGQESIPVIANDQKPYSLRPDNLEQAPLALQGSLIENKANDDSKFGLRGEQLFASRDIYQLPQLEQTPQVQQIVPPSERHQQKPKSQTPTMSMMQVDVPDRENHSGNATIGALFPFGSSLELDPHLSPRHANMIRQQSGANNSIPHNAAVYETSTASNNELNGKENQENLPIDAMVLEDEEIAPTPPLKTYKTLFG
ncbi:uncharacterized protein VTP21DRAFT_6656 [Calcarisporiella thermophila]|uniref:uncharacterized protein n=1 Tax=Calcarisporiella thermophila TaxID=911321 RepID=UPI0037448DE4